MVGGEDCMIQHPGKIRRLLIVIAAVLLLPLMSKNVQAGEEVKTEAETETVSVRKKAGASRNMIRAAKRNTVRRRAAQLVKNKAGIRLRYTKTGKFAKKEWLSYEGKIYYFGKNKYAKTGFFKYNKKVYYADDSGEVLYNTWFNRNGYSYYLKKDGTRASREKIKYKGITYKFNKKGVMVSNDAGGVKYLFVGDSRTVGMSEAAPYSNTRYIGKVSMGYSWFVSSASWQVRSILNSYPGVKVIFCFGVNDPDNVHNYISYYKNLVASYPRATFYFLSVNPLRYGNYRVVNFNSKLKSAFGTRYIDSYDYLVRTGYSSWDGIHYSYDTYKKIYNYVIKKIK